MVDDSEYVGDLIYFYRWIFLELVKGIYIIDDLFSDIVEIRFDKVVFLKENVKYVVCLRNYGSCIVNGDGGMIIV